MKDHSLGPTRLSLATLGTARLSSQCAKPLKGKGRKSDDPPFKKTEGSFDQKVMSFVYGNFNQKARTLEEKYIRATINFT